MKPDGLASRDNGTLRCMACGEPTEGGIPSILCRECSMGYLRILEGPHVRVVVGVCPRCGCKLTELREVEKGGEG